MEVINTVYFGIYIIFYCCFILCDSRPFLKRKKYMEKVLILLLICFSGLRWKTGTDWDNYFNLYNDLSWETIYEKKFSHYDIAYKLVNLFVKSLGGSYTVFLIVISVIAIIPVYFAIKEMDSGIILALVIFYVNFYLAFYLGGNRIMIALGIDLLGMTYLINGKRKKSIIAGIVGFLFHRSSIVYAIIYVLPKKICKIQHTAVMLVASYVIGALKMTQKIMRWGLKITGRYIPNNMLYQLAEFYLNELHEDLGSRHFAFAAMKRVVLILALYFIYQYCTKKRRKKFEYLYNIYLFSICVYLIFNGLGVFQVLSTFFAMTEIVLWSYLYTLVDRNNKLVFIILLFILYFFEILNAFPSYYDAYVPYTSVFSARGL